MKDDDYIISELFKGMKEEDAKLAVPPFSNSRKETTQTSYALMAVAAGLNIILFLGAVWGMLGTEKKASVTKIEKKNPDAEVLSDGLMKWETPTDELLSNF